MTKDGGLLQEIQLEDKFENMGAQMAKEVASKTDVAGDGTTTATVLSRAIFSEAKAGCRRARSDEYQARYR